MSVLFYLKRFISVLFLGASALTLYNLYGNNDAVVARAEAVACNGKPCVRLIRAERSAFGQSFTFQISVQPPATSDVECERAYVLAGAYDCTPLRRP
jgi:hypothetical protein